MNPLTDEFLDEYNISNRLFKPIEAEKGTSNWYILVSELTVTAIDIKIANGEQHYRPSFLEAADIYLQPLYDLLSKYDREHYPSFRDFYPEIVGLFNSMAREVDLVIHLENEKGEDLPDSTVSLFLPNGERVISRSTNSTGHTVFEDLLNITYMMEINMQGYKEKKIKFKIENKSGKKKPLEDNIHIFTSYQTITLEQRSPIETPIGLAAVSCGVTAIAIAAIIYHKKRAHVYT